MIIFPRAFVSLLEYAEEELEVTHVVACLDRLVLKVKCHHRHRHHRHHRRRHRHCWENRNGLQIHLSIVSHSTVLLHLVFKYACLAL